MTYSQTIAKVFAYIGYVLLIPGGLLALFPLSFLVHGLQTASLEMIAFGGSLFSLYLTGVILLIGYHRHRRGKLSEGKVIPLWIGTILFNLLLISLQLWRIFTVETLPDLIASLHNISTGGVIYLSILLWQIMAVFMGINALISKIKANQKYR